jgi:hypothetical protein
MQLERCLGHRQTRHAGRLASQGFQGADEILPFVSNLKSFGLILFGQQERGHGAVRFRDNPQLVASVGAVGAQEPEPVR